MANAPAAKKSLRQTVTRTARNRTKMKAVRELRKEIEAAIEEKKDTKELVSKLFKAIDKATKANVLHKNTAARMKSRFQKMTNASAK